VEIVIGTVAARECEIDSRAWAKWASAANRGWTSENIPPPADQVECFYLTSPFMEPCHRPRCVWGGTRCGGGYPHPYFGRKVASFMRLRAVLRCKVVQTKEFAAKSPRIRSYGRKTGKRAEGMERRGFWLAVMD
jgi:hypothetical protein